MKKFSKTIIIFLVFGLSFLLTEGQAFANWRNPRDIDYDSNGRHQVTNEMVQDYPYASVGLIIAKFPNGKTSMSTGFLCTSGEVVLTAAHCVYQKDNGGVASSIQFFPGRIGYHAYFGVGTATSKKILVSDDYKRNAPDSKDKYNIDCMKNDYAVIVLNKDVGDQLPRGCYKHMLESVSKVAVVGYYLPSKNDKKMFESIGDITDTTDDLIFYNADVNEGNSGSPVFVRYGSQDDVIGINVGRVGDEGVAVKISNKVEDLLDRAFDLFLSDF